MSLNKEKTPNHLAIIQDGNRRYAKKNGHSAYKGHEEGVEATEKVLHLCKETDINQLTVYAFSTENFRRKESELSDLFNLFKKEFNEIPKDERIHKNEIRVRAIGRIDLLPNEVKKAIKKAEKSTKDYDNFYFNIAIAYGGRKEITDSIKKLINDVKRNKKDIDKINEKEFLSYLYPHHLNKEEPLPKVDLLIRTGGEKRLSNFLLWRATEATVYFTDIYWPEFGEEEFKKALNKYRELTN